MILKALYDYYYRLKAFDDSVPDIGFRPHEIHFLIAIDEDGNLLHIEDRRDEEGNGQQFIVTALSRTSETKPYLLYDNCEYLLDHTKSDKKTKKDNKHISFVKRCNEIAEKHPSIKAFAAVTKFFSKDGVKKVKEHSLWQDMIKKELVWISFLLSGETTPLCSYPELLNEVIPNENDYSGNLKRCLITGEKRPCVAITSSFSVINHQKVVKLVSFQTDSGYDSHGNKQGNNAPISFEAESAYTNALLKLFDKQSHNKFLVGSRSFVFWSSKSDDASKEIENGLYSLFGFAEENKDDPNSHIESIKGVFKAVYNGTLPTDTDNYFYVLGLAPNSYRVAVVYWSVTNIKDFAGKILKHFSDMEILDDRKDKRPYFSLPRMMAAVTLGGKQADVQPNLPEATIKSIMEGSQYPYSLYSSALRRLKAELSEDKSLQAELAKEMRITRVAILKAYINRKENNEKNKLKIMLDKDNTNIGYVCGRLFAVLEYAQRKANGIATVKERYMNAASSTPAAVFSTLLNLNTHHVEKLNDGASIYIEKIKQEIIDKITPSGFPSHLNLIDQGKFFVGYYHQMNDMWTKKNNEPTEEQN